jgi:Abscisic acid G-protein coupled receptor
LYNVAFLPSQRSVSTVNYSDLLSNALAYGVSHLSSASIKSEDIASFSRQLSLALVGLIILTSIRYVLRGVSRVRLSSFLVITKRWEVPAVAGFQSKLRRLIDVAIPGTDHGSLTE